MSTLPYLPAGVSELPAERVILFADTLNRVLMFDESEKSAAGLDFQGSWESPTLNRDLPDAMYSLLGVVLTYSAEDDTTIQAQCCGTGLETGSPLKTVAVKKTGSTRTRTVFVSFDSAGTDLRFRVVFHTNILVNIFRYTPVMVRRGFAEVAYPR